MAQTTTMHADAPEVVTLFSPEYTCGTVKAVATRNPLLNVDRDVPAKFRAADGRVYRHGRLHRGIMSIKRGTHYQTVTECDDDQTAAFNAANERAALGTFTWATFSDGSWVAVQKDGAGDAAGKTVEVVKRSGEKRQVVLGAKVGTVYGCPAYAVGPEPSPEDNDHARAADANAKDDARDFNRTAPIRKYRGTCACGEPAYLPDGRGGAICDDCRHEGDDYTG